MRTHSPTLLAVFLICAAPVCVTLGQSQETGEIPINTPYVASPPQIVDAMLELAKVGNNDVVYDLGCGDGRIVISAAKKYGARGVGIDINADRIEEARAHARAAGVEGQVSFETKDLFESNFRDATVVTM